MADELEVEPPTTAPRRALLEHHVDAAAVVADGELDLGVGVVGGSQPGGPAVDE